MKFFERVDDGGGVVQQGIPLDQPGEHHHNGYVEQRADDECGDDANRQVTLRAFTFLGRSRDGIESDIGKENDGSASQDSRPAVWCEGMIIRGMYELECKSHEDQNGDDFHQHHDVVGPRGLLDATNQDDCQEHHDNERRPVEAEMPTGPVEHVAFQVGKSAGEIGGRNPAGNRMDSEPIQQVDQMLREANADGHVADSVFQDQVPSDNPCDEFSHRRVSVGVRAAGNRNHGGKLGVAHRCESAGDGDQDEGEGNRRAGAGASK